MISTYWHGKGKVSANPHRVITETELTFVDLFGRTYTIPVGSDLRQFETTNKGWNVWHSPDGKIHVRDCG